MPIKDTKAHDSLLIEEIAKTLRVLGVTNTINALQDARSEKINFTDKNINFVVSHVCSEFGLSIEQVLFKKSTTINHRTCLIVITYYLHSEFKYSFRQLKPALQRNHALLSKYFIQAPDLNIESKFKTLHESIIKYQKQLKKSIQDGNR